MKITKSQLESIIREELETVKEETFTDRDLAGGDEYEGLDKAKYMLGLLLAKMSSDPNTTRYADQLDKILVMMQGVGLSEEQELNELGPNTAKTDFPAGASSEYPKMLDSLYDEMRSYEARYGKALPQPERMTKVLGSILNLKAHLKRLEESLY